MIGNGYWATGIVLTPRGVRNGKSKWGVHLDFFDDGFCDPASTQGRLDVRYVVTDLVEAVQTLKVDAERIGIRFDAPPGATPTVYVEGDGKNTSLDYPANWRETAAEIADALGWSSTYT